MDYLYEYFCKPILFHQGYNLINTLVYVAIAGIILYLIYPYLKKEKKLYKIVLGFVVFGSGLRVFEDLHIFSRSCNPLEIGFYTISPGIYILVSFLFLLSYFIAKKILGKIEYSEKFGWFLGGSVFLYWLINAVEIKGAFLVAVLSLIVFYFAKKLGKTKQDKLLIGGQVLDSITTSVATSFYNCGEQHFVSKAILQINPLLFIALKIGLAYLIIKVLEKEKDKDLSRFIKTIVIVLGFATGGRDFLTLLVGTCS